MADAILVNIFGPAAGCGFCTPCRVGNVLLKERVDRIRAGLGEASDLAYLEQLCQVVKTASRCGLGQTSPNPVISTLKDFRKVYERAVKDETQGFVAGFDLAAAVQGTSPFVPVQGIVAVGARWYF